MKIVRVVWSGKKRCAFVFLGVGGVGWGRWPRAEGAGKVQEIDEPIIFHQPGLNLKSNENILAAKSRPHTNGERRYRQNG